MFYFNRLRACRRELRALTTDFRRFVTRRNLITLHPETTLLELGNEGFHTFFGYHDITPFSFDDRFLLGCRVSVDVGPKASHAPLELGLFDLSNPKLEFEPFAISHTWCWQQGCRLQWIPNGAGWSVLFNTKYEHRYVARVLDLTESRKSHLIPRPIYSVNSSGCTGMSLDFTRLQRLRPGYGYDAVLEENREISAPPGDGLWQVDLLSGSEELVFSLAEAASYQATTTMKDAVHYFNHVLWSPCGTRFFFMHLWRNHSGRRFNRAFIYDCSNGRVSLLAGGAEVSHHCWVDSETMIVFARVHNGAFYHVVDINSGCWAVLGKSYLHEDGHPSLSPFSRDCLLTDTYPNKLGEQSLLIYDSRSDSLLKLASIYSPKQYTGEFRCDLHPRWSPTGNYISFDSAHRGMRKTCVLDVTGVLSTHR
jgi:hypothetical protein